MQREKPIIFNSEMIKAILDGRKTQTRRIAKLPHRIGGPDSNIATWTLAKKPQSYGENDFAFMDSAFPIETYPTWIEPPYKVGDLLYVRETWQTGIEWDDVKPSEIDPLICSDINYIANSRLAADDGWGKCRPSIFMPKWATRIWLEVTKVRVERIQDISEKDAQAEGIVGHDVQVGKHYNPRPEYPAFPEKPGGFSTAKEAFECLWDSINKKRGHGWDENDFVWVYDFKRIDK